MSQTPATPSKKSIVSYAQVAGLSSSSSRRASQEPDIMRSENMKRQDRGDQIGPIARPFHQASALNSGEDVIWVDHDSREDDMPGFSSLSVYDRAPASHHPMPSSSRDQEDSNYNRHSPIFQYRSPQTPPSTSSYMVRTPQTGPEHSPPSAPVTPLKSMYGQQPYGGSPQIWSYGPETSSRGDTHLVSYMGPEKIGRFLQISDVPEHIDEDNLCAMLKGLAVFKALIATFRVTGAFVIVVFYDPREAVKVYTHLRIKPVRFQGEADDAILHCRPINKQEVEAAMRGYPEGAKVFENSESKIIVQIIQGRPVAKDTIQGFLEQVGQVMTIETVGTQGYVYKAEFFDTRMAAKAILQLNGVSAAGGRLKVLYDIPSPGSLYTLGSAAHRPDYFGSPTTHSSQRSPTEPTDVDVFGSTTRHPFGGSMSVVQQQQPHTPATPNSLFRKHVSQPLTPSPLSHQEDPHRKNSLPAIPRHLTAMGRRLSEPGMLAGLASQADISARLRNGQGIGGIPRSPSQAIPEQNRVFPERVANHLDLRTSVMVKDVPLSRQGLVDILNEVVPGEFDFVYLRFDFNNCCNVGYAFVNFVSTEALYHFIQTKVGKRWNLFSSDKVLQISYANIQGKQNLINKFRRNSGVMSVMEQWRPQIFYSDGAKKGLPEPFPIADNNNIMRRSEETRLSQEAASGSLNEANASDVYRYDDEFDTSSFDAHYKF